MNDTPAALARDMLAEVSRADALRCLGQFMREAKTPGERAAVVKLMAAVRAA